MFLRSARGDTIQYMYSCHCDTAVSCIVITNIVDPESGMGNLDLLSYSGFGSDPQKIRSCQKNKNSLGDKYIIKDLISCM